MLASVDIAAQQRFGSAAVQLQLGRQCRHGDERGRSTFAGECRAQNSVCLARAAPMGALLAGHCSWSRPRRPRKCRSPLNQRLPSGCLVHQHRCSFSCRSFSQNPCQCAVDEPRAKRSVLRRAPSALARKVAAAKHLPVKRACWAALVCVEIFVELFFLPVNADQHGPTRRHSNSGQHISTQVPTQTNTGQQNDFNTAQHISTKSQLRATQTNNLFVEIC